MTQRTDKRPLDMETMRASARRLLAADAELPAFEELETLTLGIRGHMMLLIPEVLTVAERQPKDDIPRYCALACVGEARAKLNLQAKPGLPAGIAHAMRLSRCLNALCDHYENLSAR
ncbi:DUF6415 family natural product biosynthesis protein [Streptomyces sp. NPDC088747]|uniref:DUF6415 family natural product biosynthesis protein n=1 Tax=Streptomyces sp. NPDC088747 TaxID=3365886 RepID=UPI00381DEC97